MAQSTTFPTLHQPARTTLHRLATGVHHAWTAYWTHRAELATVQILHSLDDRSLKDIGIDRSEIESVVHDAGRDRRVDVAPLVARRSACSVRA